MGGLNRTLPQVDQPADEETAIAVNDKQKLFVVEDDADIARLVRHHLEAAGYRVRVYSTTNAVLADALKERPALLLLDIMVPGGDGITLCRQIRQSGETLRGTPIVFMTARTSEADRIRGLEIGADDYITKPFSPRELVARVKAVLRRCEAPPAPTVIRTGDLEIDALAMVLTVRGTVIPATATEFRLLHYLARNAGRVFSRDQILDAVWKDTAFVSPRSVDVYVRKLRAKIEVDPEEPVYLRTVRGAGYRFGSPKK
jgi:two-component system phosphate regulon response regulator PhoB